MVRTRDTARIRSRAVAGETMDGGRRLQLYDEGLSDGAIARLQNVGNSSVREWRHRRGLPVNVAQNCLASSVDLVKRRAMHNAGMGVGEIARAEGSSVFSVCRWKKQHGLAAIITIHTPEQRAARMLLYSFGYSDGRIAREQKIGAPTVCQWRKRLGLPANNNPGGKRARADKANDLLARIRRAIGWGLAADIADDAAGELCIAVLSGGIAIDEIEKRARKFGNKVLATFADKWGARSLDEEIGEEPGFTLLDTLRDESSSSWLEEMGATVW